MIQKDKRILEKQLKKSNKNYYKALTGIGGKR